MRLSLALTAISLCLMPASPAQTCRTTVVDRASGSWTLAGSPYCLATSVLVETALTIEAGVQVLGRPGTAFIVRGTLTVDGTAAEPVVFTSEDPSLRWDGVRFEAGSSASTLVHASIERASASGVQVTNATPSFTHCRFRDNHRQWGNGGGLWIRLTGGDFALRDCVIEDNVADSGGGLWADLGSGRLVLERCRIVGNRAELDYAGPALLEGGGVRVSANALEMRDCEVTDNSGSVTLLYGYAWAYGGGIRATVSSMTATDCLFARNSLVALDPYYGDARAEGGAISADELALVRCVLRDNRCEGLYSGLAFGGAVAASRVTMAQCVVAGNAAVAANGYGGAVRASVSVALRNCTVARNRIDAWRVVRGPGIDADAWAGSEPSTITNSIVYENEPAGVAPFAGPSPTVTFSDVEGGLPGVGNLDVSPGFRGPTSSTACGALELGQGSPCVDAGDPSPQCNDVVFPPSLGGPRNDMGAHGGPGAAGWREWERAAPTLRIAPPRAACPVAVLDATISGGALTQPVAVFVEAVDGIPLPLPAWLPQLGTYCAAGREELAYAIGTPVCGVTSVTFRAYSLTASGTLRASNAVVW
ncbi:MAG: right-handed parallel beta-helix repeat-containing protein [Planctomycetota bacterium]